MNVNVLRTAQPWAHALQLRASNGFFLPKEIRFKIFPWPSRLNMLWIFSASPVSSGTMFPILHFTNTGVCLEAPCLSPCPQHPAESQVKNWQPVG